MCKIREAETKFVETSTNYNNQIKEEHSLDTVSIVLDVTHEVNSEYVLALVYQQMFFQKLRR